MSYQLKFAVQKFLATVTVAATVVGVAGFAALTPATALAVAPADYGLHEGDAISANNQAGDPDVYIVNDFGYKRLFVNPAIFNLYGQLSFATVKQISAATRDAFITSGLFRNCESNSQKVYGLDVTSEDTAVLHWVNVTGDQAVAQDPNFFKKVFCINNNEQALYGVGSDFSSLSQIPDYARGSTGTNTPPVVNGSVSVGLSSDNPAANTLIAGQAAGDLAHFTFSGSGTVTSIVLHRIGVSADTTLANVYLYQGNKRLTDSATVSQGNVNFNNPNGLFTVSGSSNISIKADIGSGTSGQTVGVQLVSYSVASGAAMSSTLSGNLMTIATAPSDFATLVLNSTTTPTANGSVTPQNDSVMWQNNVNVGNHDVWMKSLQLRVIGSVNASDLQNFRLQVDGVTVGAAVAQVDSNGYITFDMSAAPVTLRTGTRQLRVLGNIVGGSSRNFLLSLRQRPDLFVVDSQYGQAVLSTGTIPASTGEQDISSGTLTVTKTSDSPSGDIVNQSSGSTLARYTFTANGEAMQIQSLNISFEGNPTAHAESLRNVALYVDGSQVGSTQTLFGNISSNSALYTTYNLGSSFVVNPGTVRTLEIRGDIYDNTGTNDIAAGDTIQVEIGNADSNVQRLTSLGYTSFPAALTLSTISANAITGNVLTVRNGTLSAAKYSGYANQSVVSPKQVVKLGSFTLTEGSSEDVNVNTINVDFHGVSTFTAAKLQNVFLKVWSDTGALVLTTSPKTTVSGTASNSYSVNFTIPKTKSYTVEVYGDVLSGITAGHTMTTNLDASGLTTSSSTTTLTSEATGQVITAQAGSLTLNNGSTPPNQLINGGTTATVYSFTLQPSFDDFTLDEVGMNLSSSVASSAGAVAWVSLWDGNTQVGSNEPMAVTPSISLFTGLNYSIPQTSGTKTLTVKVQFANVGVGSNDTQGIVQVRLSHLKYHSSNGGVTNSVVNPASFAGNTNYVEASFPKFTNVALNSTVLSPGTQTIYKSSISATGGSGVQWKKMIFTVTATLHPTFTNWKVYENGADITSLGTITSASDGSGFKFSVPGVGTSNLTFVLSAGNERVVPAGGTELIELRGTVGGANVAGDSLTGQVANPSGSTPATSDDYAVQALTTGSFIWSDQSSNAHGLTTDDWFTDGLVLGLAQPQSIFQ